MYRKILHTIIGGEAEERFGEPLFSALRYALTECNKEGIHSAAIVCMLYISHFKCGFPLDKLRKYNYYIRENMQLPHFDCRMYDKILGNIKEEELSSVILIDETGFRSDSVTKSELSEALDFYTNQ